MTTYKKLEPVLPVAYPIVLFLLTFSISGYFSTIGADAHHDGIMLKPAMDVASGQMLFRDTFTQYGVLTTLLQAFSLIVFGKYLITIKLLTAFFYGLVSILLYLIFSKFMAKTLVFVIVIVWIFIAPYFILTFLPWSSVYSLFFQLLGAYFLIISLTRNSGIFLLLSGVATSLTFWCRQPVGLLMFIAVFVFFVFLCFLRQISLKQLGNSLTIFVFGNLLVSLSFVSWLLANHALRDWWLQCVVWPFSWAGGSGSGFSLVRVINILFDPFTETMVWKLLPLSTIFLLISHSIRLSRKPKLKRRSTNILLLCFIGLASWLQYYPIPCPRHMYWASTPMFCLFPLLIYQILDNKYLKRILGNPKTTGVMISLATIVIMLFSFNPDLSWRAHEGLLKIRTQYYRMDQPQVLKDIRLTQEEKDNYAYVYSEIESYLKDSPEGNVVNLTADALYNTFDPRICNVHQMYVSWGIPNSIYPDYYQQTLSYIWENQPLILTIDPIDPSLIPIDYYQVDNPNGVIRPPIPGINSGNSSIIIYRAKPVG